MENELDKLKRKIKEKSKHERLIYLDLYFS